MTEKTLHRCEDCGYCTEKCINSLSQTGICTEPHNPRNAKGEPRKEVYLWHWACKQYKPKEKQTDQVKKSPNLPETTEKPNPKQNHARKRKPGMKTQ